MKKTAYFLSAVIVTGLLYGCGEDKTEQQETPKVAEAAQEQSTAQMFHDVLGNEVRVAKDVETIVTLSPEMLLLLSDLGVKVAGTVDSQLQLPEEQDVQKVGHVNEVNMEQLLALSPDLVIGTPHFHAPLLPSMQQNNIPLAIMRMISFEDVKAVVNTYGEILHIEQQAQAKIAEAQAKVDAAVEKATTVSNKKVVVLNVTPGGIFIQREATTVLDIATLIGLNNMASDLPPLPTNEASAPFSMETLVAMQPDYIFMTIHGAEQAGAAMIEKDLKGDAAWQTLTAVANEQIHVLPASLFLTNPGLRYHEAVEYMVNIISK